MLVTVVIVSLNGESRIRSCLEALGRTEWPELEIIVVDNGSSDDTGGVVRREFPAVKLLRCPRNLGFAGGNCYGVAHARGEWIILLNDDTRADPAWIRELMEAARACPRAGILGCLLLYPDGKTIQHGGGVIHANALTDHLDWGKSATENPKRRNRNPGGDSTTEARRHREGDPSSQAATMTGGGSQEEGRGGDDPGSGDDDRDGGRSAPENDLKREALPAFAGPPRECDYVTGAAMAIRRDVWESVGPLDPGYFPIYFEETDLCWKARRAGFEIRVVPRARVIHDESQTQAAWSRRFLVRYHRHRLRFILRNWRGRLLLRALKAEMVWLARNRPYDQLPPLALAYAQAILGWLTGR